MVGTSRCDVPARADAGGKCVERGPIPLVAAARGVGRRSAASLPGTVSRCALAGELCKIRLDKVFGASHRLSNKMMLARSVFFLFVVMVLALTATPTQAQTNVVPITRSGNKLYQGTNVFRFAGANIFWLGLTPNDTYPSHFRIVDALLTAREMGANVVRSHTLGISVGNSHSIEPALNQFNDKAFEPIDYSIAVARTNGIYLIIPLADNWHFFHGGKHIFTTWRNLANEDLFYSDPGVINDFKNYVAHVLNHTNQYTGVPLRDEPAILAWETGNELNNATSAWDDHWTEMAAVYIKSISPRHLVADGHTSESNANGMLSTNQLLLPDVDLYTSHFYPPVIKQLRANAALAGRYNKVFYVGEYDWSDQDLGLPQATITQDGSAHEAGNYSARVDVTRGNKNNWYVQLLSDPFALDANGTYAVDFWAKSSSNNIVQVAVSQAVFPYTALIKIDYRLKSAWTHHSLRLPAGQSGKAFLAFNCAATIGAIWVDNVSVSNGQENLVSNPSFENTGGKWLSPWRFKITKVGDAFTNFIPAIEKTNSYFVSGDLFWDLWCHDDNHGYDSNGIPYTLHYPGDTADMQWRAQMLRTHAFVMAGRMVPAHIVPPAPEINAITPVPSGNSVAWRGSAAAGAYTLMRSTDGVEWTTIATNLTDLQAPWADADANSTQRYYYQMIPYSLDGVAGAASNVKESQ